MIMWDNGGVTDQFKIVCMVSSLNLEQKQRLEFEHKEDSTREEFRRAFSKAFTRPIEEEYPLIIKWQDGILKDPLSIKDDIEEDIWISSDRMTFPRIPSVAWIMLRRRRRILLVSSGRIIFSSLSVQQESVTQNMKT